jgi:hypothetical protein
MLLRPISPRQRERVFNQDSPDGRMIRPSSGERIADPATYTTVTAPGWGPRRVWPAVVAVGVRIGRLRARSGRSSPAAASPRDRCGRRRSTSSRRRQWTQRGDCREDLPKQPTRHHDGRRWPPFVETKLRKDLARTNLIHLDGRTYPLSGANIDAAVPQLRREPQ